MRSAFLTIKGMKSEGDNVESNQGNKGKYRYLLKNMGILTIGNFSSKILVFLLVPLYTNVLTTEEYGIYDLVFTTIQLVYPILTADVTAGVLRYILDPKADNDKVLSIAIKYVLMGLPLVAVVLAIIHALNLAPAINEIPGLELIIFTYYIFYVLNQLFIAYGKGLERVKDVVIASVISSVIMLGANVIFLVYLHTGLKGFFIANLLGQIAPVVYYVIRLPLIGHVSLAYITNRSVEKDKNWKVLEKELVLYSFPLIVVELGWWMNNASDRYVVAGLVGTTATGLLSVSYKIPSIINVIQSIFIQAWHISGVKEYEDGAGSSFYKSVFRYQSFVMVGSCAGLILLSKVLGRILFAKDFFIAWQYTPMLLISSVINAASGYFGSILSAKKDSKTIASSGLLGAFVNLVLNFVLVFFIGIQGACIATVISSSVIFFIRWRGCLDILEEGDISIAVVSWIVLIVQAVFAINEMVMAEIGTMAVFIILYRKEIAEIRKRFINKDFQQ